MPPSSARQTLRRVVLMPLRNDRRREAFLAVSAAGYFLLGLTYLLEVTSSRAQGFAWLPFGLGSDEVGWLWIVSSIIAAVAAHASDRRPKFIRWGFVSLVVPPAAWAIIFLFSWILGDHPTGYIATISYSMMAAWILMVSAWPDSVTDGG